MGFLDIGLSDIGFSDIGFSNSETGPEIDPSLFMDLKVLHYNQIH